MYPHYITNVGAAIRHCIIRRYIAYILHPPPLKTTLGNSPGLLLWSRPIQTLMSLINVLETFHYNVSIIWVGGRRLSTICPSSLKEGGQEAHCGETYPWSWTIAAQRPSMLNSFSTCCLSGTYPFLVRMPSTTSRCPHLCN